MIAADTDTSEYRRTSKSSFKFISNHDFTPPKNLFVLNMFYEWSAKQNFLHVQFTFPMRHNHRIENNQHSHKNRQDRILRLIAAD